MVSTISKLLNNLSKPEPIGGKSGKSAERLTQQKQQQQKAAMENRVALIVEQLTKWVNASHKYMDELPTEMPMNEKLKKIAQIAKQLNEQQAQISHVKRVVSLWMMMMMMQPYAGVTHFVAITINVLMFGRRSWQWRRSRH